MANTQGVLKESIWRDRDFRRLPRTAQATYGQLLSQKDLDRSGMQPLQVSKWAKGCDEVGEGDIWKDLDVLQERRFVFYDIDTDELFVRSYMRASAVTRYPNILKNALRCATLVASEPIRHEMAMELRRLGRGDANRVADLIDTGPDWPNPSETEPNGSRTVPERLTGLKGFERVREPQGEGEGVGEGSFGLGVDLGGASENSNGSQAAPRPPAEAPTPNCTRHPNGTDDPCIGCRRAREAHEAWKVAHRAQLAADVRAAVAACELCDEAGWRIPPAAIDPPALKCDHTAGLPPSWLDLIEENADA